jgi:5-methyltetrahydropteroyltriglutamate--homocysteine methyltransferase
MTVGNTADTASLQRSTERILTTHVGSLPRPDDIVKLMYETQDGRPRDEHFHEQVRSAVENVVQRQAELGVDVVDDGEMGKPGFLNYVSTRLEGLSGASDPWSFRDMDETPELAAAQYDTEAIEHVKLPRATGRLRYVGRDDLDRQLADFRAALDTAGRPTGFVTAPSPGCLSHIISNDFYPTFEEYAVACADAMRPEYEAIVEAGFILQLDSPDLPTMWPEHGRFSASAYVDKVGYERYVDLQLEVMNHAVQAIDPEAMRLHLCWANYAGPHDHDVPLERVLRPVIERARPAVISFEAANPRHEHEWAVLADLDVPEDKVLMPGVIDSLDNRVEHPQLVAQRLERFASVVGREQVIAGTDCGFGTFVGFGVVYPSVVWKKLDSLVRGAEIASERLWSR